MGNVQGGTGAWGTRLRRWWSRSGESQRRVAELEAQVDRLQRKLTYHRNLSKQRTAQLQVVAPSQGPLLEVGSELPEEALRLLGLPSHLAQMAMWRRDINRARWSEDATDVRTGMNRKLAMYRFAESHGLRVPRIYGVWETPEKIDWSALPEEFVLKSDRGAAGQGVLPLRREGEAYRLVGRQRAYPAKRFVGQLRQRADAGSLGGPFFAEELMPLEGESLPHDVKVYAFYGDVGHVLVRGVVRHGNSRGARWRYLDAEGQDLGAVSATNPVDPALPVPARLLECVEVARALSLAVPLPFVRVDLYDLPDRLWFGELTITPGGPQVYTAAHDATLGRLWEEATHRLHRDLRAGRPPTLAHGPHPVRTPEAGSVLPRSR